MLKVPGVLNRAAFWPWAICLVLGHVLLTLATISGAKLGALDSLVVIALALAVGARFRDIGWPAWIGVSFILLTMVVGTLGVTAYAIANNLRPAQFMEAMNVYGWFSGPLNLALLVLAGSMPGGKATHPDPERIGALSAVQEVPEGGTVAQLVPAARSLRGDILLAFGAVGVVVLLIQERLSDSSSQLAPRSPPLAQIRVARPETEGNGLTRDTNDYLRQLQYGSAAQTAPRYQFAVPVPPKAAP